MNKIENTKGYEIINDWLTKAGNAPFDFQKECWQKHSNNYSGLIVAPTGFGKTFSVFLGIIIDFLNHPEHYKNGLKLLWITPLRSLAKDLARAMQEAINDIGLDWEVAVRNGDTPVAERQRQTRNMPDILIVTPETLHLLFAQKNNSSFFKSLKCVAVDEWHELLGSKRGVMTELALSRLIGMHPELSVWGLSATIGNIKEAMDYLIPYTNKKKSIIFSKEKKKTEIISITPNEIDDLPWAGHLGTNLASKLIPVIDQSKTTLIFTNTRGQAEIWYQRLLDVYPELAGQLAIHHSSIDMELRIWIEEMIQSGQLKAVIATSSLDLGVDFKPVDTVIQIGSPKGVARFMQRAGRSGHSPFETSYIYFLPTHSLELIEAAALKEAAKKNIIEERMPFEMSMDVLVQYMVTLAVGEGFNEKKLFEEIKQTHAFYLINEEEWKWCLNFITHGGSSLDAYEEFHKVVIEDGIYKVKSRKIAMLHRMNIGVIVSDAMLKVKFLSGGYVGMIEEYFISRLNPGDHFVLAGRTLEFVMLKDMIVLVRASKSKKAITPSWLGGRLPLSSNLSKLLRKKYTEAAAPIVKQEDLKILKPLFIKQTEQSVIPKENELLAELISTKDGHHLFIYPFEGRNVHEIISALIAYRISKIQPISFSIAMNDYGFELLSDQPIPVNEENIYRLFSPDNLMDDITRSINATEMARRKFRDISVISGLVLQKYHNTFKTNKSLQASSGIIFNVFEEYDNQNLLLRQAYNEAFIHQMEEPRLRDAFNRISKGKIIITRPDSFTPLSFPIKVDSLRQSMSSETLEDRITRMQNDANKTIHADKKKRKNRKY